MTAVSVLHAAPVVLPITSEPLVDGAVAIAGDRIAAVGRLSELQAAYPDARVRRWPGVLTPGLVNAHAHLEYTDFADLASTGLPFPDWIQLVIARKATFTPAMWMESARHGVHQLLRSGTTCVADVVTNGPAMIAAGATGLAGISYVEMVGVDEARWPAALVLLLSRLGEATGGRTVGISPHAPFSLGTEVMRRLGALARARGMRLHVHVAESPGEVDYVATGGGPFGTPSTGLPLDFELRGVGSAMTPAAYVDSVGLLGADAHIAHGVHVDAADRALLRERRTSVALCPRSNAILLAGTAPVAAYLAEGNAISVGTDGLTSSPSLDVLDDVRQLRAIAIGQGYIGVDLDQRLVTAVTLGGADAMGLADVGRLEPGARADLAVFDVPTAADPYAALVASGAGRCVATVLGGRIVHRAARLP
ncbi:MAG: amidohydrolase family protein [Actinomycetota bacterium]